jgi:hypothetical protein
MEDQQLQQDAKKSIYKKTWVNRLHLTIFQPKIVVPHQMLEIDWPTKMQMKIMTKQAVWKTEC